MIKVYQVETVGFLKTQHFMTELSWILENVKDVHWSRKGPSGKHSNCNFATVFCRVLDYISKWCLVWHEKNCGAPTTPASTYKHIRALLQKEEKAKRECYHLTLALKVVRVVWKFQRETR